MVLNRFAASMTSKLALILMALGPAIQATGADVGSGKETVYTITLERGEDLGQNFGTLFEVHSAEGQVLLGAGFLGAYNTSDRADRHALHVFERSTAPMRFEALPRVNNDAGVYLFDRGGRLYARSAADGKDGVVRVFNETTTRWDPAPGIMPDATVIADGVLSVSDREVRYKDRVLLKWPEDQGTLGRSYYAQGQLVLWNHFERDDPRVERFLTWRWRPGQVEPLTPTATVVLQLGKKGEFPYAMGQRRDDLLVTTNQGGVYRLRSDRWQTLRSPDGKSHQVYSALNVGDSLWLGHYPSGEVIEYSGESLNHMKGYPPVMPGVSGAAREAQTLTWFGGDIYAGVWPWAELWRFQPDTRNWNLVRRMFSQPAVTNTITHPYEMETTAQGAVLNQWGQRLTSLVPLGSHLFVSTSAKSSKPWSSEFGFLDEAARKEYGLVYRVSRAGHVAAPLRWTEGPTRLRVVLGMQTIQVLQDETVVAESRRASPGERPSDGTLKKARLIQGQGLYGPAQVKDLRVDRE